MEFRQEVPEAQAEEGGQKDQQPYGSLKFPFFRMLQTNIQQIRCRAEYLFPERQGAKLLLFPHWIEGAGFVRC